MKARGKRDFAIVLLLATYGLGAAEVLGLRLEDLDWETGILRTRRAKTNVAIELRLLPAVAKAISAYLRWARPPAPSIHYVVLKKNMPYGRMTSGAIRHRIRHYTRLAVVETKLLGSRVFRHNHATKFRQIVLWNQYHSLTRLAGSIPKSTLLHPDSSPV
jgi:integrase/recombinase XerD